MAYDVTSEQERLGVALAVTPRATPDGDVTVDVASSVTVDDARADGPTTRPTTGDARATALHVATVRPDRLEQAFHTTVRLHPRQPAIVGGMSVEPGASGDHRSLCLVLSAYADETPTTRPTAR